MAARKEFHDTKQINTIMQQILHYILQNVALMVMQEEQQR